jgi:hypothetical protein
VRESSDEQGTAYPGEIEFRFKYRGKKGPWVRWLHIDYDTLAEYVEKEERSSSVHAGPHFGFG